MIQCSNLVMRILSMALMSTMLVSGHALAEESNPVQEEKHPIQLLFEEQGLIFGEKEFLHLQEIFPDNKSKVYEQGKSYNFFLKSPFNNLENVKLPKKQRIRIEFGNLPKDFVFNLFSKETLVAQTVEAAPLLLNDLSYGEYRFEVKSDTFMHYDIKIFLDELGLVQGDTAFIAPKMDISGDNLDVILGLIKKGGRVIVISNKAFAKKWDIQFENRKVKEEGALFKKGESVEIVKKGTGLTNQTLSLLSMNEGSLIEKLYYPTEEGVTSELIFFSKDIFRLGRNEVIDILKTVTASSPTNFSDNDNKNTQLNTKTNGLYGVLKIVIILLLIAIFVIIFGEPIWGFWNEKNKSKKIRLVIMEKSSYLRNIFHRYFYKIFVTLIIIGGILLLIAYIAFKWYTKSSGLDLFPNFKIDDFIEQKVMFFNNVAIKSFTLLLFIIFLFTAWLQWPKIIKLKGKSVAYVESKKQYCMRHMGMLNFFPLFLAACGVIFLYAWFFTSALRYVMLVFMIFLSFLAWIFHSVSIQWNIMPHFTEKQSVINKILKVLTISFPVIFVAFSLLKVYVMPLKENLEKVGHTKEEIITGENFDATNTNISLIVDGPANRAGIPIVAAGNVYRLINDFPVLLKIEKKMPFLEGQKGMIEIEARMKANGPLKIQTGRPATEYKKTTKKTLFTPLNAFPYKEKYKNYTVFSKNMIPNTSLDNMTLEDLIHATQPTKGIIGIYDNLLENTADEQMFIFYKEKIENVNDSQTEFKMNLQSSHFIFYAYLNGKADIRYTLTKFNRVWEGEEIEVKLIGPDGRMLVDDGYYLTRGAFGFENAPHEKKIKFPSLPEGIYQLHIRQRGREGKKESEPLDFVLSKISINTSNLVLFGNVMSMGNDTMYFSNMTPHLRFTSFKESETETFAKLGGKIESREGEAWLPQDISKIPVDGSKLSKITFPQEGGILQAPYNFYAFSEESWFYPYQFFFLEPSEASDAVILYDYAEIKQDEDFITTKVSFDYEKLVQGDNAWHFTLDDLSTSRDTSVILDSLKVTFSNL